MTAGLVEFVAVLVVAAAAVAVASVMLDDALRRRARAAAVEPELVRVHLLDDERSFEGVLVAVTPDHYRLRNASHLLTAEQSIALDGETWIPRERVLLVQRL